MQLNEFQTSRSAASPLPSVAELPDLPPPFIDPLELESLALILEHSLRVHTSHHFFCWTQGLLQNLIRHDLLICALRKGESPSFHVDSFSSAVGEPALLNNLFSQDTTLVPHLLKLWESNHFQPVFFDMKRDAIADNSNLGRELSRSGVSEILLHGTYDAFGRPASFFLFACQPGSIEARHCHLAALLIPSLHAAWVHTQFVRSAPSGPSREQSGSNDLLTVREQEILGWIYQGKSNIEIGMILGISPLTVKNHVQKILRRLNVLNRAQAVGKALALRILDCSAQR
ncbi:MAG: XrtB/PEP-CTERM-associated transcriptional regulator EpsA [Bacteroidota bacterium]